MVDPALKVVPAKHAEAAAPAKPKSLLDRFRERRRFILLVVLPLIAVVVGLGFYLSGGRYISTDNAFIGAQKVLITPDISGKVSRIDVREGAHVNAGDKLFEIDSAPFQLALTQAKAKLNSVRASFANIKTNYESLSKLAALAQKNSDLKQRDVQRKQQLIAKNAGSGIDLDNAAAALVTAQLQQQLAVQQRDTNLNQLLGNPNLPIEQFPAFREAQAAVGQAQLNLDHTVLRAPIAGIATQVDNIQLGRFVMAGSPVLSVVDDQHPWVDANPKETDVTYLRIGQKATIAVDTFPDHTFHGIVIAVSPGTGSQFSILPPQNASGNWVKVVQRVPLRIAFDPDETTKYLRAGMSVTIDIDSGRQRSLLTLLGITKPATAHGSDQPAGPAAKPAPADATSNVKSGS